MNLDLDLDVQAVRQRGSSEQRHCLLSRLTLFNQADTDMKK